MIVVSAWLGFDQAALRSSFHLVLTLSFRSCLRSGCGPHGLPHLLAGHDRVGTSSTYAGFTANVTTSSTGALSGSCSTLSAERAGVPRSPRIWASSWDWPHKTTSGNVHDLSGAITHKREIITLFLEGDLTPDIARKTNHSAEAVDRYIRDYHRIELLWKHDITDLDHISQLARLVKRVVHQYVDLLPDKIRNRGKKDRAEPLDAQTRPHDLDSPTPEHLKTGDADPQNPVSA